MFYRALLHVDEYGSAAFVCPRPEGPGKHNSRDLIVRHFYQRAGEGAQSKTRA